MTDEPKKRGRPRGRQGGKGGTSIQQKMLNGTYNEKLHGVDIPLCGMGIGDPPPYLVSAEEKAYFEYYKKIFVARKMDNVEYSEIIGMVAQAIHTSNELYDAVQRSGGVLVGKGTSRKANPILGTLMSSRRHLYQIVRSLGFTPDTMSKVVSKKAVYSVEEPEDNFFDS